MAQATAQSSLVNPLATPEQLETSVSKLDGVPTDLEISAKFAGTRLTQAAGILLQLPQDVIAQSIVIFTRFWIGPEGGSLKEYNVQDISAAAIYLTTKPSAHPRSPRSILNTYAYLTALSPEPYKHYDASVHYLSESKYHARRTQLTTHEALLLRTLGFSTHVALPHTLCINYLQALDALRASDTDRPSLAQRALAHLNTALLSPQLLYVTHQPPALATAAIYLAARETGFKLPAGEWWLVFDTEREELGFLVVAMNSMAGFAEEEAKRWGRGPEMGRSLLTIAGLEKEVERRAGATGDDALG